MQWQCDVVHTVSGDAEVVKDKESLPSSTGQFLRLPSLVPTVWARLSPRLSAAAASAIGRPSVLHYRIISLCAQRRQFALPNIERYLRT